MRLLEDTRQAISDAQQEIRTFSYMLHPPSLQEEGLERTLRNFAAGFGHRTGWTSGYGSRAGPGACPSPSRSRCSGWRRKR
ncbi:MAG: hypothetical protein ABW360_05005 [Phenylobacterium sp.]